MSTLLEPEDSRKPSPRGRATASSKPSSTSLPQRRPVARASPHAALYAQARRAFGSWRDAVAAAGLDYAHERDLSLRRGLSMRDQRRAVWHALSRFLVDLPGRDDAALESMRPELAKRVRRCWGDLAAATALVGEEVLDLGRKPRTRAAQARIPAGTPRRAPRPRARPPRRRRQVEPSSTSVPDRLPSASPKPGGPQRQRQVERMAHDPERAVVTSRPRLRRGTPARSRASLPSTRRASRQRPSKRGQRRRSRPGPGASPELRRV
jgi:hypothetical protein